MAYATCTIRKSLLFMGISEQCVISVFHGCHFLRSHFPAPSQANILIDANHNPRITNVGLSHLKSTDGITYPLHASMRWMSPELFNDIENKRPPSHSIDSDIWAYACFVLEARRAGTAFVVATDKSAYPR
jgi:hypothetical protein